MLQVDICPYASDALEDAMKLAQTKSLNSYSFSDCLSYLNYVWSDIYNQICMVDSGYYSKTVQLKDELTVLPRFVKNSIMVYAAQRPVGFDRQIYRASGPGDFNSSYTYHISGNDLLCPDAPHRTVWLEYCPQPPQIFFTYNNRDPKIFDKPQQRIISDDYNLYTLCGYIGEDKQDLKHVDLSTITSFKLEHKNKLNGDIKDITENIIKEPNDDGQWLLKYISCAFPYIFCTYQHSISGEWHSGFFTKQMEWTDYNPFDFTGRNSNVEFVQTKWNDKTGLGVTVIDHNDFKTTLLNINKLPEGFAVINVLNTFEYKASDGVTREFTPGYWYNRFNNDCQYENVPIVDEYPEDPDIDDVINITGNLQRYNGTTWETFTDVHDVAQEDIKPIYKELGWTPDTKLIYPSPEVYRYLVARLAEKFAALNESNIMGVKSELLDAKFAFQAFLKKDKSAWERMRNVNLPTMSDWL